MKKFGLLPFSKPKKNPVMNQLTVEQYIDISKTQKQIKQVNEICQRIGIEFKTIEEKVLKLNEILPLKRNSLQYCADFKSISESIMLFEMETSCSNRIANWNKRNRDVVDPANYLKTASRFKLNNLKVHCLAAARHFTNLKFKGTDERCTEFDENCSEILSCLSKTQTLTSINNF